MFYDGACGLCHRAVRFAALRDRDGSRFRFAPLHGVTFHERVPPEAQPRLPDSIVVLTGDGRLLTRSEAILHMLSRLDGLWRVVAALGGLAPGRLRDGAYDLVARTRQRLFARPEGVCPVLPPHLRDRFETR